jgi:hypothetical protein
MLPQNIDKEVPVFVMTIQILTTMNILNPTPQCNSVIACTVHSRKKNQLLASLFLLIHMKQVKLFAMRWLFVKLYDENICY